MYGLIKRALFSLDAETAHHLTIGGLAKWSESGAFLSAPVPSPSGPVRWRDWGIESANRLGLAAGLDKNAEAFPALFSLGFGHVEVGTVTPLPQPGNPQPRLFRLPKDEALINRMGFNNHGAEVVRARIEKLRPKCKGGVLGVNIGKNKDTANEDAASDYRKAAALLAPVADYLVVNVSSPNTKGLRDLQNAEALRAIYEAAREQAAGVRTRKVPVFIKVSPDLSREEISALAVWFEKDHVDGLIATNTSLSREGLRTSANEVEGIGAGGLSGAPLREKAYESLRLWRDCLPSDAFLISVGGINSVEEAGRRFGLRADLVQVYSSFVYRGPSWPKKLILQT